jgi:hypothetical protein
MGHMNFCFLLPADYLALREFNRDINDYVVDGQHEHTNSGEPHSNCVDTTQ